MFIPARPHPIRHRGADRRPACRSSGGRHSSASGRHRLRVGQELPLHYLGQFGYRLPFQIDAAGNHDGYVCRVPLPEAYLEVHAPAAAVPVIYLFRDNTVTEPQAG